MIETSADLKRAFRREEPHPLSRYKTLVMLFYEQSTRTRNTFEAGMARLGVHAHDLTPDKLQVSHDETAEDTVWVLGRMGHGIAARNCDLQVGNRFLRGIAALSRRLPKPGSVLTRTFKGREVPSGIYLSRLEAGGEVRHGKMTLVR